MKKAVLFLICIVFSFAIFSAETTPQPAAPAQTPNPAKQLQWSKNPATKIIWKEADWYCRNIKEDGYTDWRLPTIDELRSMVENCPDSVVGGACSISETNGKLDQNDYNKVTCNGCKGGRVKLKGRGWFWSSSRKTGTDHYWVISFNNARISSGKMIMPYNVYCVR